ncbi:MAG: class I SAM-dependent methyltransferase [Bacteroidales bacterium]|nr:class I SAM-dependent methyltransferase [Bacteroidales bacterium]
MLLRNCKVGVVDLSAKSLKAFSDRMKESCCQQNIIFNQVSCATQLSWIPDCSSDAVLLMGPLYHLINDEHRAQALVQCQRILKSGGLLFSVFLSPFPIIAGSGDLKEGAFVFKNKSLFRHIKTEMTTHTHFKGFDVPQYRCWPGEASNMLERKHFKTIRVRNLDGIVSLNKQSIFDEGYDEEDFLVNELRKTCESPELLGYSQQFLIVSQINV